MDPTLPFTREELDREVRKGYVSIRKHPFESLYIYNYRDITQYEKRWNNVTLNCRGLILTENDEVVSRPLPKFFNIEEILESHGHISGEYLVFEKYDGWLGVLYEEPRSGKLSIASRGSFDSEGAKHATHILRNKYPNFKPRAGLTYIFEIIHPDTRIIVDYGGVEDIVFLGVTDTKTGLFTIVDGLYEEMGSLGFPCADDVYQGNGDLMSVMKRFKPHNTQNKEGYVIQYLESRLTFKVKFEKYLALSKFASRFSEKQVLEVLTEGKLDEFIETCPDEFMSDLNEMVLGFTELFQAYKHLSGVFFGLHTEQFPVQTTPEYRKEFTEFAESVPHLTPILFGMLDNKDVDAIIWKMIKRNGEMTNEHE